MSRDCDPESGLGVVRTAGDRHHEVEVLDESELLQELEWLCTLGNLTLRTHQEGDGTEHRTVIQLDAQERFGFELTYSGTFPIAVRTVHRQAVKRVVESRVKS